MKESVRVTMSISPMDNIMEERVKNAAEQGDIKALYSLIKEKSDMLRLIDEMEFVDTPLHIAAMCEKIEFAMELMDLKPSFARKLNGEGLSPMHLALQMGDTKMVLSLLSFDKALVRLKGQSGYTPLHYAITRKNHDVLVEFLTICPDCIHDVTNRNETAYHLAAQENDYQALKILLHWLWKSNYSMGQIRKILHAHNNNGDNVLHIAASNNQPKIVELLASSRIINLKATNAKQLTALNILEGAGTRGEEEGDNNKKHCVRILRRVQSLRPFYSIPVFLIEVVCLLAHKVRHMSDSQNNALLVAAVLILTTTYQATLSPPGGVYQADASANDHDHSSWIKSKSRSRDFGLEKKSMGVGSSVLSTEDFLWFFVPNIAAFSLSFIVTCFVLIAILPGFFSYTLVVTLFTLHVCLLVSAVKIISPNSTCLNIMFQYVYLLAYIICLIMAIVLPVVLIKHLYSEAFRRRYLNPKTSSNKLILSQQA